MSMSPPYKYERVKNNINKVFNAGIDHLMDQKVDYSLQFIKSMCQIRFPNLRTCHTTLLLSSHSTSTNTNRPSAEVKVIMQRIWGVRLTSDEYENVSRELDLLLQS